MRSVPVVAALAIAGCRPVIEAPPPVVPTPVVSAASDPAAAGIVDPELAAIVRDHWTRHLHDEPVFATRVGVHDYDDRLADDSLAAIAERHAARDELVSRLERLPELQGSDRTNAALLLATLRADAAEDACRFERWNVSVSSNPLERYGDLPRRPATQGEADALVHRAAEADGLSKRGRCER